MEYNMGNNDTGQCAVKESYMIRKMPVIRRFEEYLQLMRISFRVKKWCADCLIPDKSAQILESEYIVLFAETVGTAFDQV